MIITIDGPTASGKSTVARLLAARLGIYYLYTGLLYRAVAYILLHDLGVGEGQFDALEEAQLAHIKKIVYSYEHGQPRITVAGRDITSQLKKVQLDQAASKISARADVRGRLLEMQRDLGRRYSLVADGRDCGTVVFPGADVKFFLTASLDVRARRKQQESGLPLLEVVRDELRQRDERDMRRAVAPLKIPLGGILIDNSLLTIEETVERMLSYIEK